jgi:hypothetical protein
MSKVSTIKSGLVVCGLVFASVNAQAAISALGNPSFESQNLSDNTASASLTSWHSTTATGCMVYNPPSTPALPDGDHMFAVGLSGTPDPAAYCYQDVTPITAGNDYNLTFYVGDPDGSFGKTYSDNWSISLVHVESSTVVASVSGADVADPSGGWDGTWEMGTLNWTAGAAQDGGTLRVQIDGNGSSFGFDHVVLSETENAAAPATTAVPTLSQWAAIGLSLGLGLLGLLFGSRRIQQA